MPPPPPPPPPHPPPPPRPPESSIRAAMLHSQARAADSGSGSEQGEQGDAGTAAVARAHQLAKAGEAEGEAEGGAEGEAEGEAALLPGRRGGEAITRGKRAPEISADKAADRAPLRSPPPQGGAAAREGSGAASGEVSRGAGGAGAKDLETAREKARRFLKRYEASRGGGVGRSSSDASQASAAGAGKAEAERAK
jgi:hypothetical protein